MKIPFAHTIFSLKAATMTVAVSAIFTLILASCAPIAENERLPPLQPGYGRIIVDVGRVRGRAVTEEDKNDAEYKVYFNGILSETGTHGVFPVGSTVNIRVEGYRQGTDEQIGIGTASHTMKYGTNRVPVKLGPVSGSYILYFSYGEAADLPGDKAGLPSGTEFYEGGEEVMSPNPTDGKSNIEWTHGTLSGWKYDDDNGATQTVNANSQWKFTMPNRETKLEAQWTKNTYTIHYDMNSDGSGGTQTSTIINDDTGNVALEPAQVSADTPQSVTVGSNNYTFTHWLGSDGNTYQPGGSIPSMTGDITLTAQWSDEDVWTIKFENGVASNVQQMPNTQNVVNGQTSQTWTNPTATGYTFTGWKITESDGGSEITADAGAITNYAPTQNVTLTAQWTVKTYTIRYNSNGGNLTPANTTVKITDSLSLSADYGTKTGYTFSHWKDGTDDTDVTGWTATQFIERMEQNSQTEIMLSAVWEATTYTIQFSGDGASGSQTQIDFTVEDTSKTLPQTTTFTNQGYTFTHWATSSGGLTVQLDFIIAQIKNGVTNSFEMTDNTITIYAVWQQSNYIISFNWNTDKAGGNDGSVTGNLPDNIEVLPSSGTATIPFPTVSRPGYTFLGWSENQTNSSAQYTSTNNQMGGISSSKTLYAVWQQTGTAITIKIQYIYGMGTGGNPSSWSEFLTGPHTDGSFSGDSKTLVLQDNTQLGYTNLGISETYQNSGTTYTFYGLYPANQVTVDGGAEVVSGMNYTIVNDSGASVKRPTDAVSADMNGQTYYAVYVQGALSDSTRKLIGTWQVSAAHDQQLQNDLLAPGKGSSGAKKIVFSADYTADVTMYTTATGTVTEQEISGNQWEYDGTNLTITMPGSSGSLSATLIVGSDLKTAEVTMVIDSVDKTYTYDKTN